jgi:serine/threonine-protein kinase
VVLYEITTGRLPFQGETYFQIIEAISKRAPAAIRRFRKDAPEALVDVIERMLRKVPSERYQSAAEVARDLRAIIGK